jgi:hypothetical protein
MENKGLMQQQRQQQPNVAMAGNSATILGCAPSPLPSSLSAQLSAPVGGSLSAQVSGSLLPTEAQRMYSSTASGTLGFGYVLGTTSGSLGPCVVGNDVASVAAAVAQDKLAQMQQLEALQQQLRRDVATLLPLI